MSLDETTIRRLAFIKYLYQTSLSQSHAPSPLSCASLLTMHDAVELFLQLSSEHLNTGAGQPGFMEYWEILDKKLSPDGLGQKESMRRLNKSRVALKHHGTFPSELDIESFRASTTSFFGENTPLVFGVELGSISLIEFVNPESARKRLKDAEDFISRNDTLEALDEIAFAFEEMIADYEERKRNRYYSSPFNFGRDFAFLDSFSMGIRRGLDRREQKFSEFVDRVKESIEALQGAIKILALGVDYRKYSRFKALTPYLARVMSGDWVVDRRFDEEHKPPTEEARFCLDFVVETALVLAEFDYSVTKDG